MAYKSRHITVACLQGQAFLFGFPEVEYLTDELFQAEDIGAQATGYRGTGGAVLFDFIGQAGQDGERSEQFVGNVGEVFQLCPGDFFA